MRLVHCTSASGTSTSAPTARVADATSSRDPADKALAIDRARQDGAEIVTTEMVLFEWLRDSTHPKFREVQRLLK